MVVLQVSGFGDLGPLAGLNPAPEVAEAMADGMADKSARGVPAPPSDFFGFSIVTLCSLAYKPMDVKGNPSVGDRILQIGQTRKGVCLPWA